MTRIKGVILSVEGTICPNGTLDQGIFQEVDNLIKYFRSKDIDFVIHTNRPWFYNKTKKLGDFLKERWGEFSYVCYADDSSIPPKPRAESIEYILKLKGWQSTETLYIGSTDDDMRTAVNGGLLFLRATWWIMVLSFLLQKILLGLLMCFAYEHTYGAMKSMMVILIFMH